MSKKQNLTEVDLTPAAHHLATALLQAKIRDDVNFEIFEDVSQEHWGIRFDPKDFAKIWKMVKAMIVLGHDERDAHDLFGSILSKMPVDFDKNVDLFGY